MITSDNLRRILAIKLRSLRTEKGLTLAQVAERAGLSISYLSEIETGKKYPKPDKLLSLSGALGVPYDELVSLQVGEELAPLESLLRSEFIQRFPFELFGLDAEDVIHLISGTPGRSAALVRTLLEVGRAYDVHVEQFLFAALRSYQQMHENYFEELEDAAAAYRRRKGWTAGGPIPERRLRRVLEREYGYTVDEDTLSDHPELSPFRSVLVREDPPELLVNGGLLPSQKAFIFAREIGYRELGLGERTRVSTWLRVGSFDEVLNNHRASYFAGALLIDRAELARALERFFERHRWEPAGFLEIMERFDATPEMFFYRIAEIASRLLGLREFYFMRFHDRVGTDSFRLTKVLNMSRVPVPHGIGLDEHYCRRWSAIRLLKRLASREEDGREPDVRVGVQRSFFFDHDAEFLVFSVARPLALSEDTDSCVSLGFLLDDASRRTIRFWDDPEIPAVRVGLTCERCPLTPQECGDRAAPAVIHRRRERMSRQERALAELIEDRSPAGRAPAPLGGAP